MICNLAHILELVLIDLSHGSNVRVLIPVIFAMSFGLNCCFIYLASYNAVCSITLREGQPLF